MMNLRGFRCERKKRCIPAKTKFVTSPPRSQLAARVGNTIVQLLIMGAGNGTDFLNSDFPMWAAGGVAAFAVYRAFVVSILLQKQRYEIQHAHLGTFYSVSTLLLWLLRPRDTRRRDAMHVV